MRINYFLIAFILVIFISFSNLGADTWNEVRKGIKEYKRSNSEKSVEYFKKALESKPDNPLLYYNLGDAYFQKGEFEEAEKFLKRSTTAKDINLKQSSWYNLGNTYVNLQQPDKALEAYKKAIDLNPDDFQAKYNYEYVKRQMQQNQQQQDQKDDKKQNDQNKQNKDQNQDNKNNENQDKQDQKPNSDENREKQEKEKPEKDKNQIDRKTAEQILEELRQKEEENQKKARLYKGKPIKVEKDW